MDFPAMGVILIGMHILTAKTDGAHISNGQQFPVTEARGPIIHTASSWEY